MEGFTIVDGVVAVIILISAILAYSRGFVREVLAILGWVAAAVAAFFLTPMAEPLVQEIPVINEFLSDSCELSIITAFVGVFAAAQAGTIPYPMLPYMGLMHTALGNELADFMQGKESAEQALADVEAAYTAAAKENGYL